MFGANLEEKNVDSTKEYFILFQPPNAVSHLLLQTSMSNKRLIYKYTLLTVQQQACFRSAVFLIKIHKDISNNCFIKVVAERSCKSSG